MERSGWIGRCCGCAGRRAGVLRRRSSPPPSTPDPGGTGRAHLRQRTSRLEPVRGERARARDLSLRCVRRRNSRRARATSSCSGLAGGTASVQQPHARDGARRPSIELASFVVDGATVVESGRSAALRVTVTGATAGAPAPAPARRALASRLADDSGRRRAAAGCLVGPARRRRQRSRVAPDGRVFVAEREGRVRILRGGALDPAARDHHLRGADDERGRRRAARASRSTAQFDRTHFLYAVYTVSGPEGTGAFRVVRYREVDGPARRARRAPRRISAAARPAAALGVGPDGRLYVAFDAGRGTGRTRGARRRYSGKILRLNPDGTTPRPTSPRVAPCSRVTSTRPRGLDWHPETGALWVVDAKGRDGRGAANRRLRRHR